ncbi:hypothetical protein M153_4530005642 [Pseudoloma neurophilia]|uniref:Uncharacterized protein n=1 Tax=Pseudoloma neurophilia TaxID=146866 RepID=A0A0R0M4H7_9MICR|nr:hypothetical protein M153_4530005642 [Pseudoloma neurophilia]
MAQKMEDELIVNIIDQILINVQRKHTENKYLYKSVEFTDDFIDLIKDLVFIVTKYDKNQQTVLFEYLIDKISSKNIEIEHLKAVLDLLFYLWTNQVEFFCQSQKVKIESILFESLSRNNDANVKSIIDSCSKSRMFIIYFDYHEEKQRILIRKLQDIDQISRECGTYRTRF